MKWNPPLIRGRRHWGAKPPTRVSRRDWKKNSVTVILHHTAGKAASKMKDVKQELQGIQKYHMGMGWSDIGYNFIIDRKGRVWEGRGRNVIGAHTLNHNTGSIGIAVLGNYNNYKLNALQKLAIRRTIKKLRKEGNKIVSVKTHRDMPGNVTSCPGKHYYDWYLRVKGML